MDRARYEVVLTCQVTEKHFPRIPVNGLIIAIGKGFPPYHKLPLAAWGKTLAVSPLENKWGWVVLQ